MALLPGAKVDDFEIVRLLGPGCVWPRLSGPAGIARSAGGAEDLGQSRQRRPHDGPPRASAHRAGVFRKGRSRLQPAAAVHAAGAGHRARQAHRDVAPGTGRGSRSAATAPAAAPEWTGAELLAIIDRSASLPTALDPSALHDREALARMDDVEATAWFGGTAGRGPRLRPSPRRVAPRHQAGQHPGESLRPADAGRLQHFLAAGGQRAGRRGNVRRHVRLHGAGASRCVQPCRPGGPRCRDGPQRHVFAGPRAAATAGRPHAVSAARTESPKWPTRCRRWPIERRRQRPACKAGHPCARKTLERTISRCLEPEPKDRFASGAELAEQLDGCRQLRQAERQLPSLPAMVSSAIRRPFLWLVLLVVLPQIAGSIVNITYNSTQIVDQLSASAAGRISTNW